MKNISLGRSGIPSSILGLGCMGMSEFYGERDDIQSRATLERAHDLGITHFDTSNVYGRGHNERLVGAFIRDKRAMVTVASKFGVVRDPDGAQGSTYDRDIDNSPAYMRQCCEESLMRLGTDVIDLYYVHRAAPGVPIEDTVGELSRLIEEGKIRGIGLSEIDSDTLRRANATHPIAALQSEYSLWTREAEQDVLPMCRELNITFVAYSPLGRGFLTGAIKKAEDLADSDFRLTSPRFQGANFDRNVAIVDQVQDLASRKGCTAGQVAIAWLLNRDQHIVPIPGTKRIKYLEENVAATQVSLDASDLAELEAVLPVGGAAGSRYDPNFKGNPQGVKS